MENEKRKQDDVVRKLNFKPRAFRGATPHFSNFSVGAERLSTPVDPLELTQKLRNLGE